MTSPDMLAAIAPRSDQQNADEYVGEPRVVTIERVSAGSAEQPVDIHLVGYPGRPYKPCKSMIRVLVAAWGTDTSVYAGRRLALYNDQTVKWGGAAVGGIRIAAMSDIAAPIQLALTVSRGKRAPIRVDPLPDVPSEIAAFEQRITDAADLSTLKAIAAELKTVNLGEHKARLQAAWAARETVLKTAPVDEDYGDLLDAAAGEGE